MIHSESEMMPEQRERDSQILGLDQIGFAKFGIFCIFCDMVNRYFTINTLVSEVFLLEAEPDLSVAGDRKFPAFHLSFPVSFIYF